eukprot:TRINITY_DN31694_c0_g1_i1.p1 TRINITY_DN31694_c0_g1~~TRINITY_DN31694_c0_g1_i1.p1  ORF type:complete len:311 (+),score=81.75 TRINITY_DN31694_c0_g1_i1:50-982(+)
MAQRQKEPVTMRDRTKDYGAAWNRVAAGRQRQQTAEASIEMHETAQWRETLREVRRLDEQVNVEMRELETLHRDYLKPRLLEDAELGQRIERHTGKIHGLFKQMHARVKEVTVLTAEAESDRNVSTDQLALLHNVQQSLVNETNEKSRQFRKMQQHYLEQLSRQRAKSKRLRGSNSDAAEEEEREIALLTQCLEPGFTQQQLEQVMERVRFVDERATELERILQGTLELLELFKDMQQLVVEQGTMLDRIDYNIDQTRNNVDEANAQLAEATQKSKSTCFILAALILFVAIIGFAFAIMLKVINKPSSPS